MHFSDKMAGRIMIKISSRNNPALKRLRSLVEKKYRLQYGLYMIEGHKQVREALASGIVSQVFLDEELAPEYGEYQTAWLGLEWYLLDSSLAGSAGSTIHPQGIAATAILPGTSLDQLLPAEWPGAGPGWMIYLDHINDPGNLGSLLRSAWALGVEAALLSPDCSDPFNPKAVRAASGAIVNMPLAQGVDSQALEDMIRRGCCLIGAQADGEPYYQVDFRRPAILAIGSEARGLLPATRQICTARAGIPMIPGAESLNASVAGAIILADYARRYIDQNASR